MSKFAEIDCIENKTGRLIKFQVTSAVQYLSVEIVRAMNDGKSDDADFVVVLISGIAACAHVYNLLDDVKQGDYKAMFEAARDKFTACEFEAGDKYDLYGPLGPQKGLEVTSAE